MWNNPFDFAVIQWLNQYAMVSATFNHAVKFMESGYAFKGFPVLGLIWYFWFRDTDSTSKTRRIIIGTFIGCLLALVVTTMINYIAPFQPRPIANEALGFDIPLGLEMNRSAVTGHEWLNSFPSHHAVMFFSLATGVFLISKKVGYLTFLYVTLAIAIPRVYLGLHYPSDLVSGALVGILITGLVNQDWIRKSYDGPCLRLLALSPALFQTALLIVTFEMVVIFNDALGFIKGIKGIAKYLL